jgi:NAD(P)-dependent dehydrogenase (short-subunit alcohol dehydrogenase family)
MHDNSVALVTGANKGIGLQIAKDLAAHGFTVLVGSRNLEHGMTAAKSVGADARALELDVTDQASIAAAAERIRNELGRLERRRLACRKAGQAASGDREVGPPERCVSRRGARGVRDERVRRHRRHASNAASSS